MTDALQRVVATLVAAWEQLASGSPGASVVRTPEAAVAVFPDAPVYNNALLLGKPDDLAAAWAPVHAIYARSGVADHALWIHESDQRSVRTAGRAASQYTHAMAARLDDLAAPAAGAGAIDDQARLSDHLWINGLPPGLLAGLDGARIYVLREAGCAVATAMAIDHADDCGVFNVATVPGARRRGYAGALTARVLHDARGRGCRTASLQSTPAALALYIRLGFEDLGRFREFAPHTDERTVLVGARRPCQ